MNLYPDDKQKIKLICKIFNASSLFIDNIRVALPKKESNDEGKNDK